MAQDTPDRRMAALATLAEEFGLADVYVFGSRATSNPISTLVSARLEGSG